MRLLGKYILIRLLAFPTAILYVIAPATTFKAVAMSVLRDDVMFYAELNRRLAVIAAKQAQETKPE